MNAMVAPEPGTNPKMWTSGWFASNGSRTSPDMSVNDTPPLVERMMLRPFERSAPGYGGSSPYCVCPPIQTSFGLPGGDAIGMSYEHCALQMLNELKPGVPSSALDSIVNDGAAARASSVRRMNDALSRSPSPSVSTGFAPSYT